jgi:hypothetical protein
VGTGVCGGAVGAGHQRDGDTVVGGEQPDVDAVGVEQFAPHQVGRARGHAAGARLQLGPHEAGGVHPGVAGRAQQRSLLAEPVPLARLDEPEELLAVAYLNVDVAVDHVRAASPVRLDICPD